VHGKNDQPVVGMRQVTLAVRSRMRSIFEAPATLCGSASRSPLAARSTWITTYTFRYWVRLLCLHNVNLPCAALC
jgi:hypothetical protein